MEVSYSESMRGLPPLWDVDPLPEIRKKILAEDASIVVLDDDPTGTQTVGNVPVLTEWSQDAIAAEFEKGTALFYILTNSRSLPGGKAFELSNSIGAHLAAASVETGRSFKVISRSDSTLRGHYPLEVNALTKVLKHEDAMHAVIPFFLEGGRYTIGDIHYVREEGKLIPAAETVFARDASFSYSKSDLREWIGEKTGGEISAGDVLPVSLRDIRTGGPDRVRDILLKGGHHKACIVNAADYRDLEVATLGLLEAEERGMRFVYRTAASFVRTRAGLGAKPLVGAADLKLSSEAEGVIIAGSYVPTTSAQLSRLVERCDAVTIEVDVAKLLMGGERGKETDRATALLNGALRDKRQAVLYTSRRLIAGDDVESSLEIGAVVSACIVEIVKKVSLRPSYIVAKGGITSSDIATKALGIKRAWALGQILPGVPVWEAGSESRFPGMPYIVFPGNVGGPEALSEVVNTLKMSK